MTVGNNNLEVLVGLFGKISEEIGKVFLFIKSRNDDREKRFFCHRCIILVEMINKQLIWDNLSEVMDPELDVDIVSLGLIYEVIVKGEIVKIVMTLTTPGCPLAGVIDRMVKEAAASVEGVEEENVETELVWDPPWIQAMMSEEARLRLGFL